MQNIPANSTYAKLIKMCFMAAMGWLFVGADFASLEDRINALLTKDPNKLKVYSGSKQYVITLNGIDHRIREETVVSYEGELITGEKLYEILQSRQPRAVHAV